MSALLIYLVGIADSICTFLLIFTIALAAYSLVAFIFNTENHSEKGDDDYLSGGKASLISTIILSLILTFIPSSKVLVTMIILPEIANSEVIKKDLPEIYNLAVEKLKTELK